MDDPHFIEDAVENFTKLKRVEGVAASVLGKYTRELARFKTFCAQKGIYAMQGITADVLTDFCDTWPQLYPSTYSRAKVRERVRTFLRYCFENQLIPRVPVLPKVKVDEIPTMPLTAEEYTKLLDTIFVTFQESKTCAKVHALIQLMRWSGLAILDSLTLERTEIIFDEAKHLYRVVTSRQKTGTHVSVPIPMDVAEELLTVLNGNPKYVFWSGNGKPDTISKKWANVYIAPLFGAAGIEGQGNMKSHRLRDTFACELLQRGVPMEEVSKMLGHKSIKTTEASYGAWVKGRQDRLDELVTSSWEPIARCGGKEEQK
jgi:site-specific recombinase XerD